MFLGASPAPAQELNPARNGPLRAVSPVLRLWHPIHIQKDHLRWIFHLRYISEDAGKNAPQQQLPKSTDLSLLGFFLNMHRCSCFYQFEYYYLSTCRLETPTIKGPDSTLGLPYWGPRYEGILPLDFVNPHGPKAHCAHSQKPASLQSLPLPSCH